MASTGSTLYNRGTGEVSLADWKQAEGEGEARGVELVPSSR